MLEHLRIYDETILNIYNVFFDIRYFCVTVVVVVVMMMILSSGNTKCQF